MEANGTTGSPQAWFTCHFYIWMETNIPHKCVHYDVITTVRPV